MDPYTNQPGTKRLGGIQKEKPDKNNLRLTRPDAGESKPYRRPIKGYKRNIIGLTANVGKGSGANYDVILYAVDERKVNVVLL